MCTIKLFTLSELLRENLNCNHIEALLDYENVSFDTLYIDYLVEPHDFFDLNRDMYMFEINNALLKCDVEVGEHVLIKKW